MKARSAPILVIVVASLAVGGLGALVSGVAQANTLPAGAADRVAPTPASPGGQYYSEATASRAWSAVTDGFNLALPDGYALPEKFPMRHESDLTLWVEPSAIDLYLAQEFRCGWLDAGLRGKASDADVEWAVDLYWTLPSIREADATGLDNLEFVQKIGAELGTASDAETIFALTCESWWVN